MGSSSHSLKMKHHHSTGISRRRARRVVPCGSDLVDSPAEYVQAGRDMVDAVGIDHVCIGTDTKLTPGSNAWGGGPGGGGPGPKPEGRLADENNKGLGGPGGPDDGPRGHGTGHGPRRGGTAPTRSGQTRSSGSTTRSSARWSSKGSPTRRSPRSAVATSAASSARRRQIVPDGEPSPSLLCCSIGVKLFQKTDLCGTGKLLRNPRLTNGGLSKLTQPANRTTVGWRFESAGRFWLGGAGAGKWIGFSPGMSGEVYIVITTLPTCVLDSRKR